ncbi:MAG: hypothetical protein M3280_03845, partial [Actinomycetota bacterium]|nr:hypothetical protein [Actinomycetota bacterium]
GSPAATDIGQVTVHLEGCVWYVSNNAVGNAGTSSQPFDTLAQAETASGANHTVFVFDGDNTSTGYNTGFAMNSGERLIGQHESLVVDPDQGGALTPDTLHPSNPGAHPTITATNEDVVELDDGNEVRGFTLDPSGTGGGLAGATGDTGGGTFDDINVIDTGTAGGQPGVELDGTTGTFNISNLVVNNGDANSATSGDSGVRLNNAGTVNFASSGQTSITTNSAKGLDVTGTNMGSGSVFDDITVSNSGSGGVALSSASGTTTFGDGTGTDLNLTTTTGPTAAFGVASSSTVSVASAGSDEVHATGGPAVDVTGTSSPTLEFDDVDSTNSANDGINLDGLGTGTFSATSGDITGAAGIAFDLNGGSGSVTYPGTLGNGSGATAEITGRSGGVVSLSGNINDTSDGGGGITLSSNTGGSTTFSGATKTLNTAAGNALTMASSDGHTLTLSGGNLDIDTTSGSGLNATTSGTLSIIGSGNTINSTTGKALNVDATDIGAGGLNFQSISSNGAPNGISLNNTGSTAGLNVTGIGTTAGSGGTIQSSTGDGISLTSTRDASLTNMSISGSGQDGVQLSSATNVDLVRTTVSGSAAHGINASGSNGLDLTSGTLIQNNGNENDEDALHLVNHSGTSLIDASTLDNSPENLVFISNTNTNATINVRNGSMFKNTGGTFGGDGILAFPNGTSAITIDVQNSTFRDLKDNSVQMGAATAGSNGTSSIRFVNNTIQEVLASDKGGSVALSGQEATTTRLTVTGNTFTNVTGYGLVNADSNDDSTITGTIANNTISGASGAGLVVLADDDSTSRIVLNGNNISNVGGDGIQIANFGGVLAGDTTELDVVVTNNTINSHSNNPAEQFVGGVGVFGFKDDTCLKLSGNSVIDTEPGFFDYYLQHNAGTFLYEEFPNTAATGTVTVGHIHSENSGNVANSLVDGTPQLSNGIQCDRPPA